MEVLDNLIRKLRKVKDLLPALLLAVIIESEAAIADLNIEQLQAGIRSDSSPIEPPYTPLTVAIKKVKGQPFDRVTLRDEGDFYQGIKIEVFQNEFRLIGTDNKTFKLESKYGEAILGLTQENRIRLIEEILLPGLVDKIRDILYYE